MPFGIQLYHDRETKRGLTKNTGRTIIYLLKFLSQIFKNNLFFKVPPTQASNLHNKENTISILT